MLARSDAIPRGRGWIFEPKLDGFRCLVCTHGGFRARSRRGWNMAPLLPELAGALPTDVQFDGEALSRAAITRLERVITAVETRSGISRASVGGFATHQPNPRLLTLLAKQCGVSPDAFPPICRTVGNLGSSMCGAALHAVLQDAARVRAGQRKPIFLASLGPGLLFGGSWLTPA